MTNLVMLALGAAIHVFGWDALLGNEMPVTALAMFVISWLLIWQVVGSQFPARAP